MSAELSLAGSQFSASRRLALRRAFVGAALAAAALASIMLALPVRAEVVTHYAYEDDRVYEVNTGLGITTQIELDADDEVLDFSAGFSAGWDISRRDEVFYLRPKGTDVDTNLVVRTAKRSYLFELKVVATDWTALGKATASGVQYKVAFTYPVEAAADATDALPVTQAEVDAPSLSVRLRKDRHYHFGYEYATRMKRPWLIPIGAYDDGRFTYVTLPDATSFPSGTFPAIFGRERADGEDFVVNTNVQGNVLVVHGTYPYLVLRHGRNVVALRRVDGP